jgi:uncharacterized membrane protein SirB2
MSLMKILHLTTVVVTISLFIIRGIGLFGQAGFMQQRWVKIVPHVNDTVLLVSGFLLAVQIGQYPLVDAWLTAKLLALVLYIVLGLMVFRFARSRTQQIGYWLAAIAMLIYIIGVAIRHNPMSWLSG